MATVTDAGMLTLTPVAHGTAEVRGNRCQQCWRSFDDFSVTVQAPPAFISGKEDSLPAIRIAAATLPASHALADLMTLFEDPDGDNASLKFVTETDDVKKVYVIETDAAADTHDDDAERDKLMMADGKDVTLMEGRPVLRRSR